MKDIQRLLNIISKYKSLNVEFHQIRSNEDLDITISADDVAAIENLIKEYRELEESKNRQEKRFEKTKEKYDKRIEQLEIENVELLEVRISASADYRIMELEKENQKLINELQDKDDEIRFANRDIKVFETEFIPKSKVVSIMRDIQERTEKLFNTTYVPSSSRIYNDNKERYEPMLVGRTIAMGTLQSLQELMEDK